MQLVFVRHGHADRTISDRPLSPWGREVALRAGTWIGSLGLRPGMVIVTPTTRTMETAAIVLGALGLDLVEVGRWERSSLPRDQRGWTRLIDSLRLVVPTDGIVFLVGHGTTQALVEGLGCSVVVPRENRGACFLVDEESGSWMCSEAWPGLPDLSRSVRATAACTSVGPGR